jgi:hypothetical protein
LLVNLGGIVIILEPKVNLADIFLTNLPDLASRVADAPVSSEL